MARREDKRFGSPFDPLYEGSGKITRPQERREQETHQLRGCADPGCVMCNPETAARGYFSRGGGFGGTGIPREIFIEMTNSLLGRDIGSPGQTTSGPPASYVEARKAVEQYIVKAPEQAFDDIVGNDDALSLLRDAIQAPVKHKSLYDSYGLKMPKGALLSGPPGCGKTMFARAAASEMKRLYGEATEFISISGSELQSMFVGETEGKIKALFTYAREYLAHRGHPLLIFMDEAEVLLPDRTGRVRRVASWEESQVATFLAEMDGMQESGAFVLLATNRPEVIDSAVLRDGRCDFKIVVRRPTQDALRTILEKNFHGVLKSDTTSTDDLVFAALESFIDPHKVILEAHALGISEGQLKDLRVKAFTFEHVVSGAMAASVPTRAKRLAFSRDKADGVPRGVTVQDVVDSVNALFAENRELPHEFALDEWKREFLTEVQEQQSAEARRKAN